MSETLKKTLIIMNAKIRLFIIMLVSIYAIEILKIFLLSTIPALPDFWEAILNATLLTLILSPILYYLSYREIFLKRLLKKISLADTLLLENLDLKKLHMLNLYRFKCITSCEGNFL